MNGQAYDFDKAARQRQLRSDMTRWAVIGGIVLAVLIVFSQCFFVVSEDEQAFVSRFGVIAGEAVAENVWKVDSLVEKPALEDAPSNLAVFGRYLLSPRVMELLADVEPGVGGEIQLTDALDAVLAEEEMYALVVDPADGFDTGTVESWLETNNVLFARRQG